MRKVYHHESSGAGLALSILFAVGLTALLFGFIPFAHRINKPEKHLELVKTSAIDLQPQQEEEVPPPQVEEEKPEQSAPEPQLAEVQQSVPISADLEVAVGSGGALSGFGDIHALTAAQAIKDETFDVSELEQRPEAVSQTAPVYPPELRKARIEGLVTVVFVLNEEGRVEDPRVENSSRPEFEKPALEAIRKWRFRPGTREGQPVRTFMKCPIRFRIATG